MGKKIRRDHVLIYISRISPLVVCLPCPDILIKLVFFSYSIFPLISFEDLLRTVFIPNKGMKGVMVVLKSIDFVRFYCFQVRCLLCV